MFAAANKILKPLNEQIECDIESVDIPGPLNPSEVVFILYGLLKIIILL